MGQWRFDHGQRSVMMAHLRDVSWMIICADERIRPRQCWRQCRARGGQREAASATSWSVPYVHSRSEMTTRTGRPDVIIIPVKKGY
jgi:hypothetical protein